MENRYQHYEIAKKAMGMMELSIDCFGSATPEGVKALEGVVRIVRAKAESMKGINNTRGRIFLHAFADALMYESGSGGKYKSPFAGDS